MKALATAVVSAVISSQAFAGSYEVRCETTQVPYQETVKGGEPEKVIGGALVGGVIGKAITDENAGAAAGAVIGGAIGHENSRKTVTRYKDVETCKNVFIPERVTSSERLETPTSELERLPHSSRVASWDDGFAGRRVWSAGKERWRTTHQGCGRR